MHWIVSNDIHHCSGLSLYHTTLCHGLNAICPCPNLRRGLKHNFVAKSGILGFLILFGRFLYEKKY